MEELLLTEVEYVRSLGYILTHYVPLLARPDVPQDLRGQRGRIFGNLEKLYDFHCQHFQQELEACQAEPLRVGRCFLNHVRQHCILISHAAAFTSKNLQNLILTLYKKIC